MAYKRLAGAVALFILSVVNGYGADFFPLAPGNAWTYRDAVTGQELSIHVGSQVPLNRNLYHALRGYTEREILVRVDEYGDLVYWDEARAEDVLLTSFGPRRWEAPLRECVDRAVTPEGRVAHEGPAGKWKALEVQYRVFGCADAGLQSEQFAENIGMVRRVTVTIAGPRTFDLVHARLGNQTISEGGTGGFSVSTTPAPASGAWIATLRIDQPPDSPLTLHFPSTQEYDLRLRDTEGNVLWTWSADKLFAQVIHELPIAGGLTATVMVPFPPATPEGRNLYTLEAWITNFEVEPRFAAATTAAAPR